MSILSKIFGPRKKPDPISPEGHQLLKERSAFHEKELDEMTKKWRTVQWLEHLPYDMWCQYRGDMLRRNTDPLDFEKWLEYIQKLGFKVLFNNKEDVYLIKKTYEYMSKQ